MPIYEYDCQKCGTFETTQRITDKPLGRCPTCKGKVKKLISNTSFQLKGTGWYITDYARKGNGGKEGEAKPVASKSKADSKPEKSSSSGEKSSSTTSTTPSSTSA